MSSGGKILQGNKEIAKSGVVRKLFIGGGSKSGIFCKVWYSGGNLGSKGRKGPAVFYSHDGALAPSTDLPLSPATASSPTLPLSKN